MAQPDRSPSELASVVHANGAGFKQGPFTLVSKTVASTYGSMLLYDIVVSRGGNSWTVTYMTDRDGNLGKVYKAVDDDGANWLPRLADSWGVT